MSNDTDRHRLIGEEAADLAARVEQLHTRTVGLLGDADDGPQLWTRLAAVALERAGAELTGVTISDHAGGRGLDPADYVAVMAASTVPFEPVGADPDRRTIPAHDGTVWHDARYRADALDAVAEQLRQDDR